MKYFVVGSSLFSILAIAALIFVLASQPSVLVMQIITGAALGGLIFQTGLLWLWKRDIDSLNKQIKDMSRTHDVSGLLNARETHVRIHTGLKSANRHRYPYSILILGIDKFGEVNRRFGRKGGDIIMRQVAARIIEDCREEDVVGHFHGDQFIIGAAHTDLKGAAAFGRRLFDVIRKKPYRAQGGEIMLTASIGIASSPPCPYDPEELVQQAMDMLKSAKKHGGKRVLFPDDGRF